ncbi:MAG: hypothetical protein OHK0029_19200 [Armatimonadaceae bacterium]
MMTLTVEIPDELAARAQALQLTDENLRPIVLSAVEEVVAQAEQGQREENAAVALADFINCFAAPPATDGKPWSEKEGFGRNP